MDHKNNGVVLYYADDGESICDLIASFSKSFNCTVMKHNISLRRSPRHNLIFVLILTPEMLEELENRARLCLQEVTRGFQYKILLHHEAPELQNKSTQRILEYQCPGILQWKCFTTDETDDKFSQKCFEIFNMTNMNTPQLPSLVNFKLTPKRIWTAKDEIVITLKKPENEHHLNVNLRHQHGGCRTVSVIKLNDRSFKYCPEGMLDGEVTVEVLVKNKSLGKTSFIIRSKMQLLSEILDDVISPVDFLCSTMKTDDLEALDLILAEKFTNWKTLFPLAAVENEQEDDSPIFADRALSLYPTLLHFAAKYGLSDFCKTLMKYPGYKSAREMINKDNQTPSEIASEAGHTVLAEDIKNTKSASHYEELPIEDEPEPEFSAYLTCSFNVEDHRTERNDFPERRHIKSIRRRSAPPKCLNRDSGIHGSNDSDSTDSSGKNHSGRRLSLRERERLSLPGNTRGDLI